VRQRLWAAIQAGDMFDEASGSGLGLALVKRISDAHDARFELRSTSGDHGLTVILSFPAKRVAT
jgi:nitrogen fixation/metabolism regulation signal transduction histidine kinase